MNGFSLYRRELLEEEVHPRVSAYYFKQWLGFQMPSFHTHHSVEIMYVMEGSCVIAFEQEVVPMRKGEFILIDSDVPHRLLVDNEKSCRMLNVEFWFDVRVGQSPTLKDIATENPCVKNLLSEGRPFYVLKDTGEIFHTLRSLVLELDEQGMEPSMLLMLHLSQLLIHIARLADGTWNSGIQHSHSDSYVKRAMEYIQQHYDCDIQVKDVAAAVKLHHGYLHRVFKAQTGQSILEYLTSLRVDKAKMLLSQTDIPVAEIPDYIGVNSRPYFNVLFKKSTGTTPVQYRNLEKQRHMPV